MITKRFSLGVNYWPRGAAMYWWRRFDPQEVEEDFTVIKDLGLSVVRLFMLWEDFQPEPFRMHHASLQCLGKVLDLAARIGLKVQPTFFVGHMSGCNWAPEWVLEADNADSDREFPLIASGRPCMRRIRSIYQDPWVLRAMAFNVRQVVGRYSSHPAVFGWDLSNEPENFQMSPSRDAGWLWNALLVGEIKRIDAVHPVVCGIHARSLRQEGLRLDDLAELNDVVVMHAYPSERSGAKSPTDSDVVPFTCALTRHLTGHDVLFQEFGICTSGQGQPSRLERLTFPSRSWMQYLALEEEAASYFKEVLEKLWQVGALGAWVWCYGDYSPSLWTEPPLDSLVHERSYGLVRADGTLKPHARVLKDFALEDRSVNPSPLRFAFGGITPDEYYQRPEATFHSLLSQFRGALR